MLTLRITLPRALAARVVRAARRRHLTRSALVREALERHLAAEPRPAEDSCFDLAADLAGVVRGARDLSSRRRWLRSYGR